MATRTPTFERVGENTLVVTWAGLLQSSSDVGEGVAFPDYGDRSVQLKGNLGTGGSCRIEGSNDGGATWHVLTDPQGNDLNIAAFKIEQVMEVTGLIRPEITAGDGATDLTLVLTMRRQRGGRTT